MKVTPLEIRQKSFEKVFRGYDKDEVQAFLNSLSKEWERMMDEFKEVKIKLEVSEKEIQKLREVESSLFKTLKTAEDTGANMIEQANKSAELHLKESQMNADALMSEAKNNARALMEKAEINSREVLGGMEEEVKGLEQSFRSIEDYRDNLISELNSLSSDMLEKIEKLKAQKKYYRIDDFKQKAKEIARQKDDYTPAKTKKAKPSQDQPDDEPAHEDKSFFDQIG